MIEDSFFYTLLILMYFIPLQLLGWMVFVIFNGFNFENSINWLTSEVNPVILLLVLMFIIF